MRENINFLKIKWG